MNGYLKKLRKKKCKQCGKEFEPYTTLSKCCSIKCSLDYNKLKEEIKKEILKVSLEPEEIQSRFLQIKQQLRKDNVYYYLQQEVNTIVRLIDKGHECISSGLPYGRFVPNAGHYYSVGSNKTLRYHLLNIFLQSKRDNDEGGGKGSNYSLRLGQVFGQEIKDEIESLPAQFKELKLSQEDAQKALKTARQIVRELKKEDQVYSLEARIRMRRQINLRLNIYK